MGSGTANQEVSRGERKNRIIAVKANVIKQNLCKQKSFSGNTYLRKAPRGPGVPSHDSIFSSRGRLYRMKGSDFLILLEKGETLFFLLRIFV